MSWVVGWAIGRALFEAARLRQIPREFPWWTLPDSPNYEQHRRHAEEAHAYFEALDFGW